MNGIWATGYSYRIWILLHIIPFKSDIWTRSSLSLSLSLSVFLAHTNLMQLALTMGRFVCFYFLYCLLLPLFVFCFLIIIFITFFCSSTRAARKEIPTAIVWAGQRVDSARRLTRPPHNFTVKRGSGQIYFY